MENKITAKELKKKFIDFFVEHDHKLLPSASLIPENDPTVLFTTAGMQPLIPFLLGQPHPLGKRLCCIQKCVRTGDIDEVGDKTHHTFFEMLGNWSLGDYFKKKGIKFSFEFLTSKKWLGLQANKIAVSCFAGDKDAPKDEESARIWKDLGIPEERIAFLPKKENWWGPAGETGPCGPDSEIFYWSSTEPVPKEFNPEDDRWVEIWNDVFMEYIKTKDGKFKKSEQKNVDTGMGFERMVAALQGKSDNYKTGLFLPMIKKIEELSSKKYEDNTKSMRILADHVRSSVFILSEKKIMPSNVDQGYILRRLIRRAIRHANLLGIPSNTSFLTDLVETVIELYKEDYPELQKNKKFIISEHKKEKKKFGDALEKAVKEFEKISESAENISGKKAFLLYQSFGLPIELIKEMSEEKGISVDVEGFKEEFKKHQEISRKGAEKKFKGGLADSSEMSKKLHTATHMLAEALRRVVSKDIRQKGSNITPKRLRFDFNLDRKVTKEELQKVEDLVNKKIKEALPITKEEMSPEEAKKSGAHGEFHERYGDVVSVYSIGDFSKEICGGPHVSNTSELGHFKIKKESSSAAGIRRIKAVLEEE